ncbi:hypothetical protein Lepto7376_2385 [[Leptolyngbya] sp. PCC 7376]|uniref:hypothetical protein n=1 Tax=[Leptolyngbya] sp. PCC 7376 TaxID=111781 RepID=UPI00029EFAEE|nr:hypothetical protein [[Leptolyngbya] sp. PCC 7376]AFY38667.1 hypothetical protein Lepto7376_2385 [[Leptolyngbya] sp. PCC 7376]
MIDAVIPEDMQNRAKEEWLRGSTIISSGAQIYWGLRSMGDELQSVTEITNDRLGLWMNTARNEGLVSDEGKHHQPPISTSSPYGRYNQFLEKVNRGSETFENSVNNADDVFSGVSYIASVPLSVQGELENIQAHRAVMVNAVAPQQESVAEFEAEQLLENEAPDSLVTAQDHLGID